MLKGMVYLVGAGPGDPGLITVKGRECIEKADVIFYDRLINPQLLSLARPPALAVYAGKGPAGHAMSQTEINSLLVELAGEGKVVVRLKGGDPFIFGRGGEEAEALAENGVLFEVVPGVTSAVAAPAYAGIPLTHRNFTSAVTIVAGNEDPQKENSQIVWEKIVSGAGTLVFLMGMGNLKAIVEKLKEHGRDPKTPVALIRWGTWAEQEVLTGTLADIAGRAAEGNFTNPAVIVVGEVVSLRDKLQWIKKKPLSGKRVLVTRPSEQTVSLSRALVDLGGEVLEFPTIRIVEPDHYSSLDRALEKIEQYNWLIFTSQNGVKFFLHRLIQRGKDIRDLKGVSLGAIGPKTKEALQEHGLKVVFMPTRYRAEEIVAGLRGKIKAGDRILLPRADIARKFLKEALSGMGAGVEEVVAYRTVPAKGDCTYVKRLLEGRGIHLVTFTSSSTVRNFVKLLDEPRLPRLLENVSVACIGPVTENTAREMGLKVNIVADEYTIEGMVKAILENCKESKT
jgi:uroporphyrinogen III methyltransferase/synthase